MDSPEKASELDPESFDRRCAPLIDVDMSFVHEGIGGAPLVLIHGWPETSRIWWRNIAHLAAAGFEVIAPDLRGFADTGIARSDSYGVADSSLDLKSLVSDHLGHDGVFVVGGDFGGVIAQDLAHRFPRLVRGMVLFNTLPPFLDAAYDAANVTRVPFSELDHVQRHGTQRTSVLSELSTANDRQAYVAGFYRGDRSWAGDPAAFSEAAASFMSEPFSDFESFDASLKLYEHAVGTRPSNRIPRLFETNTVPVLALYGPRDPVVAPSFVECMELACDQLLGPLIAPRAGHFLQWERPDILNQCVTLFAH